MSDNSDELLRELFWRSSLRIAVLDSKGRIILTSKIFRDSFSKMIKVAESSFEVLRSSDDAVDKSYFNRLSSLRAGERFSYSMTVPFGGAESVISIETAALHIKSEKNPLFLTEWILGRDREALRKQLPLWIQLCMLQKKPAGTVLK